MRTLIRFAILMGATICAAGLAGQQTAIAQAEKINWQANPMHAAQQAANENKLVLLHFTADWCGPCQNQKRFVFTNPMVAKTVNQTVVPVLVDIDANRQLASELGVKSIPFDVFLNSAGEVVTKRQSPSDAQNFASLFSRLPVSAPIPQNASMAKLDEMKRRFDPMNLPQHQRSNFGAAGPGNATVGVSKEAIELAAKSNYGNLLSFQKPKPQPNQQQVNAKSDLQSIVNALATAPKQADAPSKPANEFFAIPATRQKQANVTSVPAADPMHPQRSHEMLERQAFLARERANIEIPRQPTNVKPVRVLNENFLAVQRNFGTDSLKTSQRIPGLEVSDMVDARTGQVIKAKSTGRSVARFKVEPPAPQPSNKVRIVPRKEKRIAGHAPNDSFAAQAGLNKQENALPDNAFAPAALENIEQSSAAIVQPTAEATASITKPDTDSTSGSSNKSDFGLQGKCPVALVLNGEWTDGDTRWGIVHRDRTYLFSSEENYRLFRESPDKYSPILAGYDPVNFHESGDFVDGLEENGVFMEKDDNQQIVLFASAANREKFQANPQRYMRAVRQALYTASRNDAAARDAAGTKLR